MKIETALQLSNNELKAMFDDDPEVLRSGFKKDLENGDLFIGSENCKGFDPAKGCPGHEMCQVCKKEESTTQYLKLEICDHCYNKANKT